MEKLKRRSGLAREEIRANKIILKMLEKPESHKLWDRLSFAVSDFLRPNDPNLADIAQLRIDKLHIRTGCAIKH